MKFHIYYIITFLLVGCGVPKKTDKELSWANPISNGINVYGMKDFFIFYENESYFLVGTEYKNPFTGYSGPNLYTSKNFSSWNVVKQLIDVSKIPDDAWYKDGWFAPEIKKIKNKYYFTFNNRNNKENPYQKTGFGIAVSDVLTGEYKVLNKDAPLVLSNHGSLTMGKTHDEVYVTFDMDGRVFIAEIDVETASLKTKPKELLGPKYLGKNYKFIDAPQITNINGVYHMLFSQFYGGYVVKVFHLTASHPLGPWQWDSTNPKYTFIEAEADLNVKTKYPEKHGYAPPTQVVFSNQLFLGESGQYFNAYHSSEKYSEPYLCIEPIVIKKDKLIIPNAKAKNQKLTIKR